jgi:hypothetical protein
MHPLLHYLSLQLPRTFVDSPELAHRTEVLRERDRVAGERRAQRRRERVRQAVDLMTARRLRCDRDLAGRTG